jgi:hypothetical protein
MIPSCLTPGATVSAQDRSDLIDPVNRLNMAFDVWDLDTMLGLHTCMITVVQRAVSARDRAVCSERRRSNGGKRWQ